MQCIYNLARNVPNTRAISNKFCQSLNSFVIKNCVHWWVFDKDVKHGQGRAFDAFGALAADLKQWEGDGRQAGRLPPRPESSDHIALEGRHKLQFQTANSNNQHSQRDPDRFYRDVEQNFSLYDRRPLVFKIDIEKVKSFTCWWEQQLELEFVSLSQQEFCLHWRFSLGLTLPPSL